MMIESEVNINSSHFYMRNPDVVILETDQSTLFLDVEGHVLRLDGGDPVNCSQSLQKLLAPTPGADLIGRLTKNPSVVANNFQLLIEKGIIFESASLAGLAKRRDSVFTNNLGYYLERGQPRCRNLVLGITGSVVSGLMAPVLLSLLCSGFQEQLDVVLTETALKFVTRDLLESYGVRTWVDKFERRDGITVPHVSLAQSADCLFVMPATAACCSRLASGDCSDLLSLTVAATTAPVVLAPTMNEAMWNHPPVQRNMQLLRESGFYIVEPSFIFSAADMNNKGAPMYGGPGTFWRGPLGVMHSISAVIEDHCDRRRLDGPNIRTAQ
ncbi:MAG: hypothetical protein BZY80_03095 [SAR202 cluster bacterium Io17-Chloro-G2]|nr:MAG: hypothetical protein BZY80_03095 [SAR202 cluster bacterium Io17-Chloro-G2]